MKKVPIPKPSDELRPQYDVSKLTGVVRGKYYTQATVGATLVMIDPDLTSVFPNSESVNRALRVLAEAAQTTVTPKPRKKRRVA